MSAEDVLFRVIKPVADVLLERSLNADGPLELASVVEEALSAFAQSIDLEDHRTALRDRLTRALEESAREAAMRATATATAATKPRESSRE
ncbi:MAG: hypothetical protein ACXVCV_18265 [Polyangia bacterium]